MPLIRYRTDDIGTLLTPSCECGRQWDRFTDVQGRWGKDMIYGKNGEVMSLTALNVHSDIFNKVVRYQFYQNERGRCELRVIATSAFSEADKHKILATFDKKVGGVMEMTVRVVDDIPLTPTGKHRRVLLELDGKTSTPDPTIWK